MAAATALTTITNISSQIVPILVDPISLDKANANSDLAAAIANQTNIPAGATLTIESQRIDLGQLDQLRRKKLITYV